MKLISFSPWQHSTTSIPQSTNADDIVPKSVGKPSVGSSSKRSRLAVSSNQDRNGKSISHEQPDLILTSDHQISILGHAASKKVIKANGSHGENGDIVKELSQWIYTSRPGEQSSFFPKKLDESLRVGAIVDANTRSVFALQKNNTVLKIWSLDNEVTGPDEDEGSNLVDKIELSSAAVCMEAIPYKRQSRVKIKGQNIGSSGYDDIQGGVIGSLANGQIFVVLLSSTREVKVGFFGKENSTSSTSRRRSTSKIPKVETSNNHLFSVVGYTSGGNDGTGSSKDVPGQKRKAESMDDGSGNLGEITLTTLSLDTKKKGPIVFCKHSISLPSLEGGGEENTADTGDNSKYQGVSGVYTKEAGQLNLPHEIAIRPTNGNGNSHSNKPVQIAQLDPTHVGLVYETKDCCFGTILDIRYGECIVQPFPLVSPSSSASVVDIAGLSTSIFAVLTSDDLLSVYDVRRAIILHQINVRSVTGGDKGDSDYKYSIVSDWFAGTIGIVRKAATKSKHTKSAVQVSFAKIGIFDAAVELRSAAVTKPLLKGSYNLARAIASSMSTSANMTLGVVPAEVAPLEEDMSEWFSMSTAAGTGKDLSTSNVTCLVERVDKHMHGQKNGIKDSLCKVLFDASKAFDDDHIPQRVIDVVVASAVEILLCQGFTPSQKQDATEALVLCMRSGKFSGRNHFDKAINTNSKDVLRSILFAMKKVFDSEPVSKQNIQASPLHAIFSLVRYCADALPEHMMVSMVHFTICHISDDEFRSHWALSKEDEWYSDSATKVLEKRLKGAVSKYESNGSEEEKDLIQSLKNRLATSQKLFFVESIIAHSECNTALLRGAMREGLTQSDKGEVEVLMQTLSRLLRKAGKDEKGTKREQLTANTSSCIAQWLSALVDVNLGTLLNSKGSDDNVSTSIEATKEEVSATVTQTQALMNLKELLDHVQLVLEHNNSVDKKSRTMDVTRLPLYGTKTLIF